MAASRAPASLCTCLLASRSFASTSATLFTSPASSPSRPRQVEQRRGKADAIDNGRRPIAVPPGVTFEVDHTPPKPTTKVISPVRRDRKLLYVKGPKGRLEVEIPYFLQFDPPLANIVAKPPASISLAIDDERIKTMRQMYNTVNTHMQNACIGVTRMHEKTIDLVGVGYRAALEKPPYHKVEDLPAWLGGAPAKPERPRLVFRLGFAHPHYFDVPDGWDVQVTSPTHIVVRSPDKIALGA
jgi:large subunit ribosomal protein L6